jgi:hypothetical protein
MISRMISVEARHRRQLERLCRYLTRPPISNDRLSWLPDGRVSLRLKTPFKDGTTHLVLTPHAFIERLCALIPRPRSHRVRYHGVFAPASPMRSLVVPLGEPDRPVEHTHPHDQEGMAQDQTSSPSRAVVPASTAQVEMAQTSARRRVRWILWAELMKRTLDLDVFSCPKCAGRMRVIAAILKADVVSTILRSLESKNLEAPSMRPARAPPDGVGGTPGGERFIEMDLF